METLKGVKKIAVEACLKYTDAVEEIRHLRARIAELEDKLRGANLLAEKRLEYYKALEAKLAALVAILRWLDIQGGLGYEKHDRIRAAVAAAEGKKEG